MGIRLQIVTRSLWFFPAMAGGCNGCHLEILACLAPRYDLERFGVCLAPSVRRADVLLITGSVTQANVRNIRRLYNEMPKPGLVVAVGTCALGQGLFLQSPAVSKALDGVLSVDLCIPGCPPRPEAVIAGFGKLVKLIRQGA